jgi:16S rRNA (uracil1498-N3)-methyltransferase
MNRIILLESDFRSDKSALLTGRRLSHLREILGKQPGESVRAGLLGGKCGTATIVSLTEKEAILEPVFTHEPPSKIPLTLIVAMQRPKTLKKILQYSAAMGVMCIYIIRTWRTDKSYFSNSILTEKGLLDEVILGLEQAGDTIPPEIFVRKKFRPFVEDELPVISEGSMRLAAHPYSDKSMPRGADTPVTLALGPEGGFIPFEIELLEKTNFTAVHIGERILRTENALPAIIGKLF